MHKNRQEALDVLFTVISTTPNELACILKGEAERLANINISVATKLKGYA